jgi:hypothetical protein
MHLSNDNKLGKFSQIKTKNITYFEMAKIYFSCNEFETNSKQIEEYLTCYPLSLEKTRQIEIRIKLGFYNRNGYKEYFFLCAYTYAEVCVTIANNNAQSVTFFQH